MACLVILKICKYPCPSSNWILSLHPFKVKTTEELSLKKSHKGSLRKFCFEIGELFEVKWNIKIGESDEMILNKGQTKGIVSIWFEDLISKIHAGKHYLLCNFLKTLFWEPCCLWGAENIHSHFCFAKTETLCFQQGRFTKSHPERQKMFSREHSQNWLLPPRVMALQQAMWSHLAALPAVAVSTFPIKEILLHSRWCIKIPEKGFYGKGIINPSMSAGSEGVRAQISNSRLHSEDSTSSEAPLYCLLSLCQT